MLINGTNTDDRKIVEELLEGNEEEAFCLLYTKYKNRVSYFISRFIKDNSLTQDITQDVFISLWSNRRFIDTEKSFSSYLFTIAKNRVLNELRSLVKEKTFREYIIANAKEDVNTTEDEILANNIREIIEKTSSKLTERQRQIFILSRENGLSNREIADRLEISVNTVQYHISEALKVMRNSLKDYPEYFTNLIILYSILFL